MEVLWQKIKRNLSRSYKSIRHDWKQYLSFFVAIFLMQSFFWLLMLTQNAQVTGLESNAKENYDYHLSVSGLTQNQAVQLQNSAMTVFTDDKIFDVIRVTPFQNSYGDTTYTAYIFLLGDSPAARASQVQRRYIMPLVKDAANASSIRVTESPLLTHIAEIDALTLPYVLITLLFSIVAALVLMLLYNIRINHFKFLYGIYMTFGADYRKLLFTAAWELITVSLLTLAPALGFAALVRIIFVLFLGGSFAVSLWTIPLVFILNLIVIFAAVALPMRFVSMRVPNTLLAAQDNSNLVSSPRRSRPLFG
ncbi:MAG: hypothetical protein IKL84_00975, partial [Clostridia bacterium]|nr:hypothetical protein [Clostridia bacterium]